MRISIIGTRGIPARYGGFETLAEALAVRFTAAGHGVTVYCRKRYHVPNGAPRGVKLVVIPTINLKYFDMVIHTFLSVLHNIIFVKTDSILLCNSANAVFIPLLKLFGRRVVINVDGLEWKRKKWNIFGRLWYLAGERLSVWFADKVVTDARVIEKYYKEKFGKETVFIPYGADVKSFSERSGALKDLGLERGKYILYVGRLEPENNADYVLRAYSKIKTDLKLTIVGDAPYSATFIKALKDGAGSGAVFCGAQYGDRYKELLSNALFCVNASEVGGTHPAIVEAMAAGKLVLVNDAPENLEVIGDAGLSFSVKSADSLEKKIKDVLAKPDLIKDFGKKAEVRVKQNYSWELISSEYLAIL